MSAEIGNSTLSAPPSGTTPLSARNYLDRVLSTQGLRHLVKNRRTPLVPESLADYFRYRFPEIYVPDAPQLLESLDGIVDSVRKEFAAAGITSDPKGPVQSLNSRERRHAADFSALLGWVSEASGIVALLGDRGREDGEAMNLRSIDLAIEGAQWGKVSGDPVQEGLSLAILALRYKEIAESPDEATTCYMQAIELLEKESGDAARRILFQVRTRHAVHLVSIGEIDAGEAMVEAASKMISPELGDIERATRVRLLTLRMRIAQSRKDFALALSLGQQGLSWSDPEYDPVSYSGHLQSLAMLYSYMEYREEGLKLLLNAISALETYGLVSMGAWVYITASEAYHRLGELKKAEEILDRIGGILGLDQENLPEDPKRIIINIVIGKADLLIDEHRFEEAWPLLEWTCEKSRAISFLTSVVSSCALRAVICKHEGRYREGCRYLEEAIEASSHSSRINQLRLRLRLIRMRALAGDIPGANELLENIRAEIESFPFLSIDLMRCRSLICELSGNLAEALRLEREASSLEKESLENSRESSLRFARIAAETGRLEQTLEQERELRRRLEHQFAEMVLSLEEKEKIIAEAAQNLRDRLREGRETRRKPGNGEGNGSAELRSLLSILARGEQRENHPLSYLGEAGDEFSRRLRQAQPGLTASQERLCILIRAGLGANEICRLLGIGSEGLKSRRKRLRKTLNIPQGESLETWLGGV